MSALLAAFLFILSSAGAQETQHAAKLSALFELLESNNKFMGTVAVSKTARLFFNSSME